MSAPEKQIPGSQNEDSSKIQVEPLKENELGQVEGGFSEMSGAGDGDGGEINTIGCPSLPNRSQCTI